MGIIHEYDKRLKHHKKYVVGKGLVNVHHKQYIHGKGMADTFLNLVNNPLAFNVIKDVADIGSKVHDIKKTIDEMKALKISKIKKDIKTGNGFKYI